MSAETYFHPRVGVPWRTAAEESAGKRWYYDDYFRAIRGAGGEPVEVSLSLPRQEFRRLCKSLDAVLLTGSPADVDPGRYGAARHALTAAPDPAREQTDDALLDYAVNTGKPLLAICYGIQSLNVHFGGSLLQDIPSELGTAVRHDHEDDEPDAFHQARIEGGSLSGLSGTDAVTVNSSHHQSILQPGRGLTVVARAPDGVIEAVELAGSPSWIVGVQWHPERMPEDTLAQALFGRLIAKARTIAGKNGR